MLTADYSASGELYSGFAYIANLNNSTNKASSFGEATAVVGTLAWYIGTTGLSPTTNTTMIKIRMAIGNLLSGTATIYALT